MDDDDDLPLVPCPHCREAIVEDSEQCPYCGMYISREDSPGGTKSILWIVLMALALIAAALMLIG